MIAAEARLRAFVSEPLPITHLDEDEIADIHEDIAHRLSHMGLRGHRLDLGIAAMFRAAVMTIQDQRRQTGRPRLVAANGEAVSLDEEPEPIMVYRGPWEPS